MAYEMEALATGWRMGLHASDWKNLVALAHQYGWRPKAGLDSHLGLPRQVVVPAHEARELAAALEAALADLPRERRKEFRPAGSTGGVAARAMRFGPDLDPKDYFAWKRRWIVEEVVRLCRRGAVEIRPM